MIFEGDFVAGSLHVVRPWGVRCEGTAGEEAGPAVPTPGGTGGGIPAD